MCVCKHIHIDLYAKLTHDNVHFWGVGQSGDMRKWKILTLYNSEL